jgi:hypothetical protein
MRVRCPNRVSPPVMVLVAACAVAACSTTPLRTTAEKLADADIAGRVQAVQLADPDIYARHIDIAVNRGVVHSEGMSGRTTTFRPLGAMRPRFPV